MSAGIHPPGNRRLRVTLIPGDILGGLQVRVADSRESVLHRRIACLRDRVSQSQGGSHLFAVNPRGFHET